MIPHDFWDPKRSINTALEEFEAQATFIGSRQIRGKMGEVRLGLDTCLAQRAELWLNSGHVGTQTLCGQPTPFLFRKS